MCQRFSRFASSLENVSLAAPGRELERLLVCGAVVYRLAVRHDHVLERELEKRP
jgi:hypothetical protein